MAASEHAWAKSTVAIGSSSASARTSHAAARATTPDVVSRYRETILGFNLGDDYDCPTCWGGEEITQAQIASWAAYTRARIPSLPLGVRMTPDWVQKDHSLAPLLDYLLPDDWRSTDADEKRLFSSTSTATIPTVKGRRTSRGTR